MSVLTPTLHWIRGNLLLLGVYFMGTFSYILISLSNYIRLLATGKRYDYGVGGPSRHIYLWSEVTAHCSSQCSVGPSISKQTLLTFTDKQRSQSSHHTKPTQTDRRRTTSNIGERERPEPQNQLGCPSSGFLGIIM